jgi:hypothetical protein
MNEEKVKKIREWAQANPEPHVETNGEHYKKEFGFSVNGRCGGLRCPEGYYCNEDCPFYDFWNKPYHAPESVKE